VAKLKRRDYLSDDGELVGDKQYLKSLINFEGAGEENGRFRSVVEENRGCVEIQERLYAEIGRIGRELLKLSGVDWVRRVRGLYGKYRRFWKTLGRV